MKLDFIEVSGFRGFRDKLRVNLGAGFTVICGRNGVGKSSLCDAIEFVLTGQIDKYPVEKAAKETLGDYIWWRGAGTPKDCYATLGFRGDDNTAFTVTRSRESGLDRSVAKLEALLCVGPTPDEALRQLCRTAIIRDEWIAALSLDLTETERFNLVQTALGAVDGPNYLAKGREVVAHTEAALARLDGEYEEARAQLNTTLTQLSEARDSAGNMGDVAAALALINDETETEPSDLVERIAALRARLSFGRMRLNRIDQTISEGREIALARDRVASLEFQQAKSAAQQGVERAVQRTNALRTLFEETRARLSAAQEADELAASLSLLIEHGERLGLYNDHCPLCAAQRSPKEFEVGLTQAQARLNALGSDIAIKRQAFAAAEQALSGSEQALATAEKQLADIVLAEEQLRGRETAQVALFAELEFEASLAQNPDAAEVRVESERNRLLEFERAILTLEASVSVQHISDLEERVATLRRAVDTAADRVTEAQAAVASAKSIERGVRRASAEIIDERLALISPLLDELYQRLRPHADWRSIQYSIRGDVRRFLSLKVGDGLNPQFVFSTGQRRAAGLAFLLSIYLSRSWCRWKTLVLDDPVQHIDDFRALHLVEVLAALRHDGRQIVCAVEDSALAELLTRRLISSSSAPGRRYDIEPGPSSGNILVRSSEIPPMPLAALRPTSPIQAAE
jgi:chromosome segregation protein